MSANTTPVARRAHFIGIFTIALAVLAYQVVLTRLFSVVLFYHFAFAGISLAMLGLTMGALRVYTEKERFSAANLDKEWAAAAFGFAASGVLLVLWFLYCPLIVPASLVFTVLCTSLVLFTVPFAYSGVCVALILTKLPSVGRLYAADLAGAALGCISVVGALFYLEPVSVTLLLCACVALSGWYIARTASSCIARRAATLAFCLFVAGVIQGALYATDSKHLSVVWAKNHTHENVLFERWNVFSRVRVIPYPGTAPFGWGFGRLPTKFIEQRWLDIDTDAATMLTHFDGDTKPIAFLADDVINLGYHLRPVKDVAVIGVGGGRDILSAIYFAARSITGIELNPSILAVLRGPFSEFTGHLDTRSDVHLVNAEARSWLASHNGNFDLVQISLIDTWAATAAGGLTLTENRLYTTEAWKEFLNCLTSRGMLVVSRWFKSDEHYRGEFYRLLSLAVSALEQKGITPSDAQKHFIAMNGGQIITVATSLAEFTPEEVMHIRSVAKERGFTIMAAPGFAVDDVAAAIASGKADKAYYDSLPLDVTAPTDDRPFFFYMIRWSKYLFSHVADLNNNVAVIVVLFLLAGTFICAVAFIGLPLLKLVGYAPVKKMFPHLAYFSAIGLGFMLIEISQMQRLIVFLGHPVFGLCVVLFTLLLFGGLGSFTVGPEPEGKPWLRPLLLCLVLIAVGCLTASSVEAMRGYGTLARIAASVLLLAPAGFCMGMMFPLGMKASAPLAEFQPWFWCVNGVTSVFASILGMAISMQYGISAAYWTGVACYAFCLLLTVTRKRITL